MFGPLPRLYRLALVSVAVALGLACGVWVAELSLLPVARATGAATGALVGLLVSYPLTHDSRAVPRR